VSAKIYRLEIVHEFESQQDAIAAAVKSFKSSKIFRATTSSSEMGQFLRREAWIRFRYNTGDIVFENLTSPQFEAGEMIRVDIVDIGPDDRIVAELDWGRGQFSRIYSVIEKFDIVPEMEVLALVADGRLDPTALRFKP